MKINIAVTKAHIEAGIPRSIRSCPIALALQESTKANNIFSGNKHCSINGNNYALPDIAVNFISVFDTLALPIEERHKIQPFSFELDLKYS